MCQNPQWLAASATRSSPAVAARSCLRTAFRRRALILDLLTGHAASIPNEEMAKTQIENVGRRPHIRRVADLRLPLDTPRQKVQRAVQIIEELLQGHEGMREEFPPRVFFTEFEEDCFTIRMMYWYAPPDYWDFIRFSQDLNFKIFAAFEDENISFSLPSRLVHTNMEGGLPAPIGGLQDHAYTG